MSPPIRDGSGSSIGSIRLGDGSEIAEVRTGAGDVLFSANAIPDSVVRQYVAPSFATPWTPDVGTGDMSITGLAQSTFPDGDTSVFGDGVDDHGLAPAPNVFNQLTFGFAFTVNVQTGSSSKPYLSADDGTTIYQITTDADSEIRPFLQDDNGNRLSVASPSLATNTTHAVIINKSDDTPSGIDIYVDDMSTPVSTTTRDNSGYDSANASNSSVDMGFYARNLGGGSVDLNIDAEMGTIEFANSQYNQSQRDGFVSRRPEVQ